MTFIPEGGLTPPPHQSAHHSGTGFCVNQVVLALLVETATF